MAALFITEQWIAADVERVFRFFADPRNLPAIIPPRSGAKLVSLTLKSPAGVPGCEHVAGAGSEIVISVRIVPWLPVRARWTAQITRFEYGAYFAYFEDEQISGPFRLWKHRHEFEAAQRNGMAGTLVRDRVKYEVGYGPLGPVADAMFVRRMLRQIFAWRHRATERILTRETT